MIGKIIYSKMNLLTCFRAHDSTNIKSSWQTWHPWECSRIKTIGGNKKRTVCHTFTEIIFSVLGENVVTLIAGHGGGGVMVGALQLQDLNDLL